MNTNSPSLDEAADEIAREMARVHEDSYGRPAASLEVALHERFVAVVVEVELAPAEAVLAGAGQVEAVRVTREQFAEAIRGTYEAIIERATGRRVESFASRLALEGERPWSAEIFLLAPPAGGSGGAALI